MKTLLVILLFIGFSANAQFKKAEIKIHGLTCSICSRSVEMALKKVNFVDKIDTDLETTLTTVTFKEGVPVYPELLSSAVDKAGFSVGYIKVQYHFNEDFENCYQDEVVAFTRLLSSEKLQKGVREIIFIEKDMMNNSLFKNFKEKLPVPCKTDKRHYYVALAENIRLD